MNFEVENSVAALRPVGQGSLTEQTTRALLDAIFDDQFPDGRLPPEPALAESLNVSRTTVRAALQSLERLGMVSRTPGRGTIVLPHVARNSIALQRLVGFRALLEEHHKDVDVKQHHWVEQGPSPEARVALDISEHTAVAVTSKLFIADGQPAIHISDQIPLHYCAAETQEALLSGDATGILDSIFIFSRTWPNREIHHTVVELISAVAPEGPDFPLALSPGNPYLNLQETHYTVHGEPVAYSAVLVDDRYLRFQVVRHL